MELKYMLMSQKNPGTHLHQDKYITEELARKEANRLFTEGYYNISVWSKTRNGWSLIKEVKQHPLVAKAKQEAHAKSLIPEGATIIYAE